MARVAVDIRYDHSAIQNLLEGRDGDVAKDLLRRAIKVEGAAKRYCPVRTGRLRSSIGHELGKDAIGLYALIGSEVNYAYWVEMGTRYRRASAFLRPALREAT